MLLCKAEAKYTLYICPTIYLGKHASFIQIAPYGNGGQTIQHTGHINESQSVKGSHHLKFGGMITYCIDSMANERKNAMGLCTGLYWSHKIPIVGCTLPVMAYGIDMVMI